MAVIGELATLITARTAPFMRAMGGVRRSVSDTRSRLDRLSKSAFGLTSALTGAAGAGALFANSLRLAAEAEQAEVAFKTLLGSADAARQTMADLQSFAASTPFQLGELTGAARKLAAFGTATDEILPTLRVLGDLSAGTGNSISEMAELFGKMQVQGRLFAEDINQLTGRGIPVIQALAEQFGVADSKVKDLVKDGKVGFGDLRNALIGLTGEGSKFGGMMEAQSQTMAGTFSTLKDAFAEIQRNFGRTVVEVTGMTEKIQDFTTAISMIPETLVAGFFSLRSQMNAVFADIAASWASITKGISLVAPGMAPGANMAGKFLGTFAEDMLRKSEADALIAESAILRLENMRKGQKPAVAGELDKVGPGTTGGTAPLGLGFVLEKAVLQGFENMAKLETKVGGGGMFPGLGTMIEQSVLAAAKGAADRDIRSAGALRKGSAETERLLSRLKHGSAEREAAQVRKDMAADIADIKRLFETGDVTVLEIGDLS